MVNLYYTTDDKGEVSVPCERLLTIGRDKGNDIVLPDMLVSRNHAMIRHLGAADYYLIDSGSSNGSRVNQRRIATPTLLSDGDRITIGATEFRFEQISDESSLDNTLSMQETMLVHQPLIKEITILVADMRGFTSMSEQLPIQALTQVMNEWFNLVNEVIAKHGGTVDKFIGDCVFARWEDDDPGNNVVNALRTACLISEVTTTLSDSVKDLPAPLRIGVGINSGIASLDIGSDNTALGDSVNTAFRLESSSKELGVDIVLSESAYAHLDADQWQQSQHQIKLKGKRKEVSVVWLNYAQVGEWLKCR